MNDWTHGPPEMRSGPPAMQALQAEKLEEA